MRHRGNLMWHGLSFSTNRSRGQFGGLRLRRHSRGGRRDSGSLLFRSLPIGSEISLSRSLQRLQSRSRCRGYRVGIPLFAPSHRTTSARMSSHLLTLLGWVRISSGRPQAQCHSRWRHAGSIASSSIRSRVRQSSMIPLAYSGSLTHSSRLENWSVFVSIGRSLLRLSMIRQGWTGMLCRLVLMWRQLVRFWDGRFSIHSHGPHQSTIQRVCSGYLAYASRHESWSAYGLIGASRLFESISRRCWTGTVSLLGQTLLRSVGALAGSYSIRFLDLRRRITLRVFNGSRPFSNQRESLSAFGWTGRSLALRSLARLSRYRHLHALWCLYSRTQRKLWSRLRARLRYCQGTQTSVGTQCLGTPVTVRR